MRKTLHRSAEFGGHFPDCIPGALCHCPLPSEESAVPARLIRATRIDPRFRSESRAEPDVRIARRDPPALTAPHTTDPRNDT